MNLIFVALFIFLLSNPIYARTDVRTWKYELEEDEQYIYVSIYYDHANLSIDNGIDVAIGCTFDKKKQKLQYLVILITSNAESFESLLRGATYIDFEIEIDSNLYIITPSNIMVESSNSLSIFVDEDRSPEAAKTIIGAIKKMITGNELIIRFGTDGWAKKVQWFLNLNEVKSHLINMKSSCDF